jgi:pyruvate dehydrogenase E2 component (dihydrolipoamide acetyltransferase)
VPYDLLMPQLGMTMTEGCVVQWLKKPGEAVQKGEFLLIVQTDKVDIEIESPCSGTLAQVSVELGQFVPVGSLIGRIAQAGESSELLSEVVTPIPASAQKQPIASIAPTPFTKEAPSADSAGSRPLSQRAKKVARELGVDIWLVPDYDGKGRIVEADVQRFFEERSSAGSKSKTISEAIPGGGVNNQTSSAARKAIAERMTVSFQTIPHFYLTVLSDATELVKLRESLVDQIEKQVGVRLSYTDILLKALAAALRTHPEVNSYWQNGAVHRDRINVGFATQAPDRLVVPVVRDADKLPLAELAKVRGALVARARSGKLQVDDLGNASCTLSNLGSHGVDHFQAIINPPESVILAAGRIAFRPMVANGTVVPRQTIYLSLSVDHRLVDGIAGAAFLSTLVRVVESPETLLPSASL